MGPFLLTDNATYTTYHWRHPKYVANHHPRAWNALNRQMRINCFCASATTAFRRPSAVSGFQFRNYDNPRCTEIENFPTRLTSGIRRVSAFNALDGSQRIISSNFMMSNLFLVASAFRRSFWISVRVISSLPSSFVRVTFSTAWAPAAVVYRPLFSRFG